ncbi:MAG: HlyD family secretion protein [Candidatus Omnitrophica bacterium]|nr:HlyD family secretion protein [Candidatus Omnitrophota bacterium]
MASESNGNGKSGMKRMIGAVIAAFVLGAGVVCYIQGMGYVSTDDAYIDGRIHQIAPKVPGTVKKILVADNQMVHVGDVLAKIDAADYRVKVDEADAALNAEKARLSDAEAKVSGAEAQVEIQETTLKQALLDAGRAERLFAEGALTKEKLEKAQTNRDLAKAQVKAAKEQIIQAKAYMDLERSLIQQREASLETARLNLSYTEIVAPADGFITRKAAEEGNQVQAGQPLMAVVALGDVWVTANYKETQLEKVKPGQAAEATVDVYPGHVFKGKVQSLMAGTGAAFSLFPPENALGNYVKVVQRVPVKIVLDRDDEHVLRVGMSVVAKIRIKE